MGFSTQHLIAVLTETRLNWDNAMLVPYTTAFYLAVFVAIIILAVLVFAVIVTFVTIRRRRD